MLVDDQMFTKSTEDKKTALKIQLGGFQLGRKKMFLNIFD